MIPVPWHVNTCSMKTKPKRVQWTSKTHDCLLANTDLNKSNGCLT